MRAHVYVGKGRVSCGHARLANLKAARMGPRGRNTGDNVRAHEQTSPGRAQVRLALLAGRARQTVLELRQGW